MTTRKQTRHWKQRDGTPIRICDMGEGHLFHTIRLLIRAAEVRRIRDVANYLSCTPPTADMAELAFEQELDLACEATWRDHVGPLFEPMLLDWERRGGARADFDTYGAEIATQGARREVVALLAKVPEFGTEQDEFPS